MADFRVSSDAFPATVYLVTPLTMDALEHLRAHVDVEAQWLGRSLAVGHRYINDLMSALQEAGFDVEAR